MRGCTTFVEPAGRAVSPGQLRTPESKVRALDACGIPSKCWDFSSTIPPPAFAHWETRTRDLALIPIVGPTILINFREKPEVCVNKLKRKAVVCVCRPKRKDVVCMCRPKRKAVMFACVTCGLRV
ncbi:hypothetical protein L6452_39351 [Arctium lappa]|uniref:Uncharacterized protein n=1 Tax=Arctium lappa TaxID=4217 RepID=A0ACB8XT79_ARCLA|nr:hypothetical protein L6452_39351 [Arctium lappa]